MVDLDLAFTGGQSTITVPPLGSVSFRPYVGPVGMNVVVLDIDKSAADPLLSGQESVDKVEHQTISEFDDAVVLLIAKSVLFSLLGVVLMSSLLWRRPREALISVGISLLLVLTGVGLSAANYDSAKVREPTFTGTLAQGSGVVGDVKDIELKYTDYREALVKIVTNVSRIYSLVTDLPAQPTDEDSIRVLRISDIHLNPAGLDLTADLVKQFKVDFVVDTGDINDWGTKFEDFIVQRVKAVGVPYVYVKGNHDSPTTVAEVAKEPNALVLDNRIVNVDGLTIAGIGDPRFTPDKADGDDNATVTKSRASVTSSPGQSRSRVSRSTSRCSTTRSPGRPSTARSR